MFAFLVVLLCVWLVLMLLRGGRGFSAAPITAPTSGRVCPVCVFAYDSSAAPINTQGSRNPLNHRCDRTGTWRAGHRYGLRVDRFYQRLATVTDAELQGWPAVAAMRAEYLSTDH